MLRWIGIKERLRSRFRPVYDYGEVGDMQQSVTALWGRETLPKGSANCPVSGSG